jgi:hypothetical protein
MNVHMKGQFGIGNGRPAQGVTYGTLMRFKNIVLDHLVF